METVKTQKSGADMFMSSSFCSVGFDVRYGDKGYPFTCILRNVKLSDALISKIESSKIVKVDPEFSYFSDRSVTTVLFLVPKFGYSLDRIMLVFYALVKDITDEHLENV